MDEPRKEYPVSFSCGCVVKIVASPWSGISTSRPTWCAKHGHRNHRHTQARLVKYARDILVSNARARLRAEAIREQQERDAKQAEQGGPQT